jgi:hypothetical protein
MCGHRRTTAAEELAWRYYIPIPPQRDLPISWNIAPSQDVLAIRLESIRDCSSTHLKTDKLELVESVV